MKTKRLVITGIGWQVLGLTLILSATAASFSSYINGPHGTDSWMPIYIGAIILAVGLSYVHAGQHAILIKRGVSIRHKFSFVIRALVALLFAFIVHGTDYNNTLRFAFVEGSVFWIAFDLFLNKERRLPLFYVTKYYKEAAIIDKTIGKVGDALNRKFKTNVIKPMLFILLKLIVFVVATVLYL